MFKKTYLGVVITRLFSESISLPLFSCSITCYFQPMSAFLQATWESPLEVEMDEEDIKETLRDVLNELYSKENKKERTKPS
jgi:hypothetical protein